MSLQRTVVAVGVRCPCWACTVGPDYRRPDAPTVPNWKDPAAQGRPRHSAHRSGSSMVADVRRSDADGPH